MKIVQLMVTQLPGQPALNALTDDGRIWVLKTKIDSSEGPVPQEVPDCWVPSSLNNLSFQETT